MLIFVPMVRKHFFPFIIVCLIFGSCSDPQPQREDRQSADVGENQPDFAHVNYTIPDSMEFCGEWISFTDLDLRERLDRELLINTNFHSSTMLFIKRANRFFPEISSTLKTYQLPDDLKYLAVAESGLSQATSGAGAKGFWQFMPATAKDYNLTVNEWVDERLHIEKSTAAACKYLKNAFDSFGSWSLAIASYNRGAAGVNNDMEWQDSDNYYDTYMNNETARYLFRMLAIKLIMEHPDEFGFNLKGMELYAPYKTNTVKITGGIDDIADWAREKGTNYKIVKLLNPWILKNQLPGRDTFEVLLPTQEMNLKPSSAYL